MITFLTILSTLLLINVALLLFSVNGARERFRKLFGKISDNTVIKLPQAEFSESKYKKAV